MARPRRDVLVCSCLAAALLAAWGGAACGLAACSTARRAAPAKLDAEPAGTANDLLTSRFFPPNYTVTMFIDYAAMRECGLLAMLERMPMFEGEQAQNAHQLGYEADDVDRVFTVLDYKESSPRSRLGLPMISVAETAPDVAPQQPDPRWQAVEIGGCRGFRSPQHLQQDTTLWPRPGIAVQGDHDMLEARCNDGRPAGGPHPDVRQLLAGERVLFQYAFGRFGRDIDKLCMTVGFMFPFHPDDPVDFVRLRAALDAEGGVVISLLFKYESGTSGLRATEEWVRKGLADLDAQQDLAFLRPLLRDLVVRSDGRDLDMTLPLGQPRAAMQKVERVTFGLMGRNSRR
jgi:hypothetical protein